MGCGSTGKILHVDLTRSAIRVQAFEQELYRLYPGGKALASYLLVRHVAPGTDPLGPENVLVLATGLLTGAPLSTATRFTAAARSPLTGAYGESEAGGFWGPELKMAGFDAIVVTGRSERPVYVWVHDGQADIRDAAHIWGREPEEAQDTIRRELGDRLIRVLQIGAGGENLVRYAAIVHEMRHYNGRTGMGAVMGSKNLQAIAVRGSGRYLDLVHDPAALVEMGRVLAKRVKEHPQSWDLQDKGTPGVTTGINAAGVLPTRNFRGGAFEAIHNLGWEAYEKELLKARRSCYACAIRCKRGIELNDRYQVSGAYGGPEYEAVASFGPDCGVDDLQAIAKANELCARYVLDVISTGACIAFAMECFEHELIGLKDTDGLELRFGNATAMLELIEMIAHRRSIGNLLAEGVRRAAEVIGGEARYFALHVKGQELPMHDPRGKVGVGLAYAISDTGADHVTAYQDPMIANPNSVTFQSARPLGITEALPARELSVRKAQYYGLLENWNSMGRVVGLCYFGPAPRSFIHVDEVVEAIRAATGWDVTMQDLMRIGERATNLSHVFNVRQGFSRKDDVLPDRLFEPLESGALTGVALSRPEFEQAMNHLYTFKGWDPVTGIPTRDRLRSLDLEWAADLIQAP